MAQPPRPAVQGGQRAQGKFIFQFLLIILFQINFLNKFFIEIEFLFEKIKMSC